MVWWAVAILFVCRLVAIGRAVRRSGQAEMASWQSTVWATPFFLSLAPAIVIAANVHRWTPKNVPGGVFLIVGATLVLFLPFVLVTGFLVGLVGAMPSQMTRCSRSAGRPGCR